MSDEALHIPKHLGVIMDGNRRWARERDLPTLKGHEEGAKRLKEFVEWIQARGVREAIFYAFSTENWNRSKEEVSYLMNMIDEYIGNHFDEFIEKKIRVSFVGQIDRFSEYARDKMRELEDASRGFTGLHIALALSYGGRAELLQAIESMQRDTVTEIDEDTVGNYLWTKDFQDPDLVIRTGGMNRLSNFLPWQSVYSELRFTDTYWPDMSEEELDMIFADYAETERRRGK